MHEHQPGAVRRVGPVLERAVVVDDVDDHEVVAGHRGESAGQLLELLPDRLELGRAVLLGGGARRLGSGHRVVQRTGHRRLVRQRGAVEATGDGEGPEPHPAGVVEVAAVIGPVPSLDGKALALGRVGLGHGTQAELGPASWSITVPRPTTGPSAAGTAVGMSGFAEPPSVAESVVSVPQAATSTRQATAIRARMGVRRGSRADGSALRGGAGPGRPGRRGARCRTAPPRARAAARARRAGTRIRSTMRCSSSASKARIHS